MPFLPRLASIVRWIVDRGRAEGDLNDELEAFVDMAAADKVCDGVARDEARRLAVIHLGGVEQAKRVRTHQLPVRTMVAGSTMSSTVLSGADGRCSTPFGTT